MEPPIAFFDLETRSELELPKVGLHRYIRHPSTETIVFAVHFPDGESGVWAPEHRRAGLSANYVNEAIVKRWNDWVENGGLVAAWNAQFDRGILKYEGGELAAPSIDQTLCAMAQAENFSLPGALGKAASTLRVPIQKDIRGKTLIRKFCNATLPWDPRPDDLMAFWDYALKDVLAMRDVWKRCRPWAAEEWADYHVLERINERGLRVDIDFAHTAVTYAQHALDELNTRLRTLTGDPNISLASSTRKITWLESKLAGTELESAMETLAVRKGEKVKIKSANRAALNAIRQAYEELAEQGDFDSDSGPGGMAPKTWSEVQTFTGILDEGNGVAVKKFAKMIDSHVDGRLYHQFRCSPTVTGRHAARGVQFDNVLRDALPKAGLEEIGIDDQPAPYAIDALMGAEDQDACARHLCMAFDLPITKILARLIRPSILAEDPGYLVWGDWSAIEARTLPWLANAEHYLGNFRNDVCIYSKAAVEIFGLGGTWEDLYAAYEADDPDAKYHRLVGKVAVLALGYQGGVGALNNMASGYGLRLEATFANQIKNRFRNANPWLVKFWRDLDTAIWGAVRAPGLKRKVGRLSYVRHGDNLHCFLPDGRPITYPQVRIEKVYKKIFDAEIECVTYRKMWSGGVKRGDLYPGVAVENATQGTAASLLRELLKTLDARGFETLAPKHDEVLIATDTTRPEVTVNAVKILMETNPSWAKGLPLKADVRFGPYYGK